MTNDEREFGFATRAIHAGTPPDPATGSRAAPIYQTAAYVFGSTEQAAELFALRSYGHIYSRISNPTVAAFEERMASLEGGLGAIAFSSGLAAQLCTVLTLAQAGDHLVCTQNVYGGTVTQLSVTVKRMGIETTFVSAEDPAAASAAIRPETRLLFVETIGNPSGLVADLRRFAEVAHAADIPLVVDNTFATPYFQQPLALGAQIVVHSTTKYIGGHSDVVGGIAITDDEAIYDQIRFVQNAVGGVPGPQDAWLTMRGAKTLALRMREHARNAQIVAEFLESRADVARVNYPGLESHPQRELAERQMSGFGGMLSFELRGPAERALEFARRLKYFSLAESLGGVESLICHPGRMTHGSIPKEERERRGITDRLLRLSVGIEDAADLLDDLREALDATADTLDSELPSPV